MDGLMVRLKKDGWMDREITWMVAWIENKDGWMDNIYIWMVGGWVVGFIKTKNGWFDGYIYLYIYIYIYIYQYLIYCLESWGNSAKSS